MKNYEDITIIIKTFERKRALVNLLNSIKFYYKNKIKILIADDSKITYRDEILKKFRDLDIIYYTLPFDVGLSEGRNFLLKKVKTKYFLLCDDDFEFTEKTDLKKAYEMIEKTNFDILGGSIENIIYPNCLINIIKIAIRPFRIKNFLKKKGEILDYNGKIRKDGNIYYIIKEKIKDKDIYSTDIVMNFFLGNTNRIKLMEGWQPSFLKVGEHEIFFIRAKEKGIKVGFLNDFLIKHYPVLKINYYKYRKRRNKLFNLGCKVLNISIIME